MAPDVEWDRTGAPTGCIQTSLLSVWKSLLSVFLLVTWWCQKTSQWSHLLMLISHRAAANSLHLNCILQQGQHQNLTWHPMWQQIMAGSQFLMRKWQSMVTFPQLLLQTQFYTISLSNRPDAPHWVHHVAENLILKRWVVCSTTCVYQRSVH